MKQYKVIVSHTGSCEGYHFTAGKETTLPETVIKALGRDAQVLEEIKEEPKQEEKKEIKNPLNKMVGTKETTTK